jgi:hypothetical protein
VVQCYLEQTKHGLNAAMGLRFAQRPHPTTADHVGLEHVRPEDEVSKNRFSVNDI